MLKVYRKPEVEDFQDELLGDYLNILPVIYTNEGDVVTDVMVYYLSDDGTIGTDNRNNVLIKETEFQHVPNILLDENEISRRVDNLDSIEGENI